MEEYVSLKVKLDIRKALRIKSAKEDLHMRDLTDKILREKLIEEGDLLDE